MQDTGCQTMDGIWGRNLKEEDVLNKKGITCVFILLNKALTLSQCNIYGVGRSVQAKPAGETLLSIFSGPHNQEVNLEAREYA